MSKEIPMSPSEFDSRSPAIQEIIRGFFDGEITKSEFIEKSEVVPHRKASKRKGIVAFQQAERLEKRWGYLWKINE